jgi:5-methylcytosine-specific restriction protein A
MPTYLLTWNPKLWSNSERREFAEEIAITASGTPYEMSWSTGKRKNIQEGDRLFIVRQGAEPKGIIAAGWAIGESFEGQHWNKKANGQKMWYVMGRYDRILNADFPDFEPPLSTASFTSEPLASVRWSPRSGGMEIPEYVAEIIEDLWEDHLGEVRRATVEIMSDPDAESFPEGHVLFGLHRRQERNSDAIDKAKAAAKKKQGRLACCICSFDFGATYGELGEGFIEVHHTRPLSELSGESEPKVADIALVCSNCHRMLHRYRPWLGIAELKVILAK